MVPNRMTRSTGRTTRRRFLTGVAATASALAVGTFLPRPYAAEPLRVSSYAGKFEELLAHFIYPAFTKETGIAIDSISQTDGMGWFDKLETAAAGVVPLSVELCEAGIVGFRV